MRSILITTLILFPLLTTPLPGKKKPRSYDEDVDRRIIVTALPWVKPYRGKISEKSLVEKCAFVLSKKLSISCDVVYSEAEAKDCVDKGWLAISDQPFLHSGIILQDGHVIYHPQYIPKEALIFFGLPAWTK